MEASPVGEGRMDPFPRLSFVRFILLFSSSLFLRSFLFLGEYGKQEIREPYYDGRAPHGFAKECRSGTVLGLFL